MEDDDDVSLDTTFIHYIMHMKENVTLISPETGSTTKDSATSFMYLQPNSNEPKKAQMPQCCAFVWDRNMKRRCKSKVEHTSSSNRAFKGCQRHNVEYEAIVNDKIQACRTAQDLYLAFNDDSTKDDARAILRSIFLCLEYRIIIMNRFFQTNTECERKLKGHIGALNWFQYETLFEVYRKATQKNDSELEQQVEKDIDHDDDDEEPQSDLQAVKANESQHEQEDDIMFLWKAAIEHLNDKNTMESTYKKAIDTFTHIGLPLSKIEYDPRFELAVLFKSHMTGDVTDSDQDEVVGLKINDRTVTDGRYTPEEDRQRSPDRSLVKNSIYLTQELGSDGPSNYIIVTLKRTYARPDGELAFSHNLFFAMFQKNGIIGCGYWIFQRQHAYQFQNKKLDVFAFITQYISHGIGNIIDSNDTYDIGSHVVLINLKRDEFNGKIVVITKKLEEDLEGNLYFQVQLKEKLLKVKMKNMISKKLYYSGLTTLMCSPRFGRGNIIFCKANEGGIKFMKQLMENECIRPRTCGANLKIHDQTIYEIITGNEISCDVKKIESAKHKNTELAPTSSAASIVVNYPASLSCDITFSNPEQQYINKYMNIDTGKVRHETVRRQNRVKQAIPTMTMDTNTLLKQVEKVKM